MKIEQYEIAAKLKRLKSCIKSRTWYMPKPDVFNVIAATNNFPFWLRPNHVRLLITRDSNMLYTYSAGPCGKPLEDVDCYETFCRMFAPEFPKQLLYELLNPESIMVAYL